MHNVITRQELFEKLANDLLANDLLNLSDYNNNVDSLLLDVVKTINICFDDYTVVEGNVLL